MTKRSPKAFVDLFMRTLRKLRSIDVRQTLATQTNEGPPGLSFSEARETDAYTVSHTVEDGIERVAYEPKDRRFETPILMQHGMWHGAWCWRHWQELFAEWGWASTAHSLPGHAKSPTQRPIISCTLDYYLYFLKSEVERLPRPPVLFGHSMGGALAQWYLKYVGDDLPAAVLVAAWQAHNALLPGILRFLRLDPRGSMIVWREGTATPMIRTPQRAARLLITEGAIYTPEELHARLGPESGMVSWQQAPPSWKPPENVQTPLLWLAGGRDAVLGKVSARRSAAFYGARFVVVKGAGHDLMIEHNYRQTAETVHRWLVGQGIA